MSPASPETAIQRNGPMPSQNSGRMNKVTNDSSVERFGHAERRRAHAQRVAVFEDDRAAAAELEHARARGATGVASPRRSASLGIGAARAPAVSAGVIPDGDVAALGIDRALVGDDVRLPVAREQRFVDLGGVADAARPNRRRRRLCRPSIQRKRLVERARSCGRDSRCAMRRCDPRADRRRPPGSRRRPSCRPAAARRPCRRSRR